MTSAARLRRSFSYCPKARSPRCCHPSVDVRPCPASRRRKTKPRSPLNCQWVSRKRPNEVGVRRHSISLSLPTSAYPRTPRWSPDRRSRSRRRPSKLGSSSAAKTEFNSNNANQPSTASINQSVDQHDTDRSSGKKRASSDQSINHRPRKHVNSVLEAELAEMRQTMKLLLEENKKMKNELIELRAGRSVTDTDVSSSESELMHEDQQANSELSLSSPSNHSINHSFDQSVKDRVQPERPIDYRLNSLEDNVKELKNDVSNFMLSMERQLNDFFARAAGTTLNGNSSLKRARVDNNGSGPPPATGANSINGQ